MQLARFHALSRHPHTGEQDVCYKFAVEPVNLACAVATIREVTYDTSRHPGGPFGEEHPNTLGPSMNNPGIIDVIGMPVAVCRTPQYVIMHTNAPWSPIHEAHFG